MEFEWVISLSGEPVVYRVIRRDVASRVHRVILKIFYSIVLTNDVS